MAFAVGMVRDAGRIRSKNASVLSRPANLHAQRSLESCTSQSDSMKQLKLTNGGEAIVDDCVYERVSQYKWFRIDYGPLSYAKRRFYVDGHKRSQFLHRFICNLKPGELRDHINGNGLDCRFANLRPCTIQQNAFNHRKIKNTKTQFKGVWKASKNRWAAEIVHSHKRYYLGLYQTPEDAAEAYNQAAKTLFGEFAFLNRIPGSDKGATSAA